MFLLQQSNQHIKSDIDIQYESNVLKRSLSYYSHTLQFTQLFNYIITRLSLNSLSIIGTTIFKAIEVTKTNSRTTK